MIDLEAFKVEYLAGKQIKLSQKRHLIKLIDKFVPMVDDEEGKQVLINVLDEFIDKTNGLDRYRVRNAFVSLIRPSKPPETREIKGLNCKNKIRKNWGRPRIINTPEYFKRRLYKGF